MPKTLLTLATPQTLSYFEPSFRGFQIRQCHSLEALKIFLKKPEEIFILAEFPACTPRHVDAFLSLRQEKPALQVIIYSPKIDFEIYRRFPREPGLLLINEAEKLKIPALLSKFTQGQSVFVRSTERHPLSSPVLVKSTQWVATAETLPQRKGRFVDFARLGAKLYLPRRTFKVKDYISVLYQSSSQEWITVECQLRWESPTPDGGQLLGVQFLAIA